MNEIIDMINALIIDNNTNQVTPAKVRQVLTRIVEQMYSMGGAIPSITAVPPLDFDGFTGVLQRKTMPFGSFERIGKGWKPGTDPAVLSNRNFIDDDQAGDFFKGSDTEGNWYLVTRWSGQGDKNDPANHIGTITSSLYFEGEPGYEHD